MIPSILSQTWKSAELPAAAAALQRGWRSLNPELEYRFYDDAACREVVAETFPLLLADYDRLPAAVMKADVFRYAVIYRDGGIYADIDMECLRPVKGLLAFGNCLVAIEAHLGRTRQSELGYPHGVQIANCIFAAAPGHPFIREAVERAVALSRAQGGVTTASIEDVTGPRMLTRLLFEVPRPDVVILPQIVLMAPLDYPNIWPINRHMHARHRTFGTWKGGRQRPPLRRRLIERNRPPSPLLLVPRDVLPCHGKAK